VALRNEPRQLATGEAEYSNLTGSSGSAHRRPPVPRSTCPIRPPNQRRTSILGAKSLSQRRMAAFNLGTPRGQMRSTKKRPPSPGDGRA
jgi:hypothetical protein